MSAESDSNLLQQPPSSLKCCWCEGTAWDPWQHENCGQLVCRDCLKKNQGRACPKCLSESSCYFQDKRSNSEIQSLPARCSHQDEGCEWIGTMETLQGHVTKCTFAMATASSSSSEEDSDYENYDDVRDVRDGSSERKEAKHGLRQTRPTSRGQGAHDTDEKPLPSNETAHMYEHVYDNIVNDKKSFHADSESDQLQQALSKCTREILELKMTVSAMQRELTMLRKTKASSDNVFRDNELTLVTLTNFASKKTLHESFQSQILPTYHPGGHKIRLQIFPRGQEDGHDSHLSVHLKLVKCRHISGLRWPFEGLVTIQLLNQQSDGRHFTRRILFGHGDGRIAGRVAKLAKFISHTDLCRETKGVQYLRDDTLHFLVGVANNRGVSTTVV